MDKRDKITIAILLFIFLIIFVIIYFFRSNEEEIIKETEFNELTLVDDDSILLSLSNNIDKICRYSDTAEQALKYIASDDIVANSYKNMTFKIEQAYVISRSSLYKYYIKGSFYTEIMDETPVLEKTEYFILNLDTSKLTFNVEKIDKVTYDTASQKEKEDFIEVNRNDYNSFEYTSLTSKNRAILYFTDFIENAYLDPEKAYNKLTISTQDDYFNTLEDFKDFLNSNEEITAVEYNINGSEINIKDNNENEYVFRVVYYLKYDVEIIPKS